MSNIFIYEKQEDGTLCITGCCSSVPAVIVPPQIDGCAVTVIAKSAFCANTEKLFLPPGIQHIEDGAFAACPRVNVYCCSMPAYEYARKNGLFAGLLSAWDGHHIQQIVERVPNVYICESFHYILSKNNEAVIVNRTAHHTLNTLVIPNELDGRRVAAIGKSAFREQRFKRIILPSGLREIGETAFEMCFSLEEVIFPDGLAVIGDRAFNRCDRLTSLDLPKSLVRIGSEAFRACEALDTVIIRSRSAVFGSNVFACRRAQIELGVREPSTALDYARQHQIFYTVLLEENDQMHHITQEECTMKDPNCGYCMHGELLAAYGIYMCDLSVSKLYLFKEQSHPGRCIVAYKDHISEIVNLSDEERNAFFADVNRAAKAIHAAYHPDKLNYGAYGDTGCHLHFHLVPKYRDGFEWGGTFAMNPGEVKLTDAEYEEMIAKIKANL